MINTIGNVGVCVLGLLAIWFLSHKQKWMRWGYIIGLASEPFWVMTVWGKGQPAILFMCAVYAYCYVRGIWNYWVKDNE